MLFIVISADIRRGREGLTLLTKGACVKNTREEPLFDFVEACGEFSKNQHVGSASIMNAVITPFENHDSHDVMSVEVHESNLDPLDDSWERKTYFFQK